MTKKEFIERVKNNMCLALEAYEKEELTTNEYLTLVHKSLELIAPMVTDDEKEDED